MTVRVVGSWELGWTTPIQEKDLWMFMVRDFGVDQWCMTPRSGIRSRYIVERESLEQYVQENQNLSPVYIDEDGEVELPDFKHPENALYILGKASYSPFKAAGSPPSCSVRIPTQLNLGILWPHQAIAIALYDRMIKDRGA